MDYAACNVVYVDRSAQVDKLVKRDDATSTESIENASEGHALQRDPSPVNDNIRTLLGTFSEVHICTSGKSCISKLSELNQLSMVELIPTLVLVDIPYEDQLRKQRSRDLRTPSPSSSQQIDGIYEEHPAEEAYGLKLLQWIASEIQYQSLSRLVVPVAVVTIPDQNSLSVITRMRSSERLESQIHKRRPGLITPLDQARTMRYLDVGAVDVLTSPLLQERLPSLAIHAYRAHKDASKEHRALLDMKRGRKRSWVGVDDQKPYAYLREAMVSGLMDGICKLGDDDEPLAHIRISIAPERREKISAAVASWNFCAHDFTDDELLHAALLMLQHALAMPELEKWRISTENLTGFLVASRSAYNAFVPYHNFRHVVDVLQAIFHFLVRLGRLPPFPALSEPLSLPGPSPIAELIRPFDALTLLITAIGHDVGHPGVNNAFLVTLNAPLAQLYNDRSVLESFHCAAYSQILRRHWPAAFQGVEMRQLMISSILATDMGLHFEYMKKLGFLQEKLHDNGGTDGWTGRLLEEQRTLACSLLIKCADISNVAREYHVASQWTMILTDEFSRQASMEQDLGIPSALFAPPVREVIELGKSQLGFMNMFAIPLFQGVTDVMPGMGFCVDELNRNKVVWEGRIAEEQSKVRQDSGDSLAKDGTFSPRTMSVANPSDGSIPKIGSIIPLSPDTDLRKMLLTKASLSPLNNVAEEQTRSTSLPALSTEPVLSEKDMVHSPHSSIPGSSPTEIKPSQLKLSFATASAPGRLDQSTDGLPLTNGAHLNGLPVDVTPSLVTDAVIADSPADDETPKTEEPKEEKQRSSDGTEGSSSAAGDWASQATSATTGKMPLSPSTQGTSIMSSESTEKNAQPREILTPTGTRETRSRSCNCQAGHCSHGFERTSDGTKSASGSEEGRKDIVVERFGKLKKKPSRFRMNFWKRNKSSSPPVAIPVSVGAGGEEERGDGER